MSYEAKLLAPFSVSGNPLLICTDYSVPDSWKIVRSSIKKMIEDNFEFLDIVESREYDKLTKERLMSLLSEGDVETVHSFITLADSVTMTHPEHPLLVVDLSEGAVAELRVVPSELMGITSNLAIANMDFEEFVSNADADGIFRGFE